MFKNIGKKLKTVAKIGVIGGIVICVFLGIAGIASGGTEADTMYGWFLLIVGTFLSLVYGLVVYGFGELIETNQRMYKLMLRKVNAAALQTPMEDDAWVCEECGNINKNTNAVCAKCGATWERAGYNSGV